MKFYHEGIGRKTVDALQHSVLRYSGGRNDIIKYFNFYFSFRIPRSRSYSMDAQTNGPTPLQSFSITGSEM